MSSVGQAFLKPLAARSEILVTAREQLSRGGFEVVPTVRRVAHGLVGSGSLYGFPDVSVTARALEDAPERDLIPAIDRVLQSLQNAEHQTPGMAEVLIVTQDAVLGKALAARLANPGRGVHVVTSTDAAAGRLLQHDVAVLVLDTDLLDQERQNLLLRLRLNPLTATIPIFLACPEGRATELAHAYGLPEGRCFDRTLTLEPIAESVAVLLEGGGTTGSAGEAARPGPAVRTAAGGGPAATGGDILLAEDDDLVASLVTHRLQRDGYRIRRCADGDAALSAALEAPVSLAILDVKMPGMDGFQLLDRLRGTPGYSATPILLLTAMSREKDVERGFALGADDYMTKPFSPVELLARIHRLLQKSTGGSA
ncbi:MAG: response regulator [Planctomycetes bacterium]|nr:response regulator [Planctomycetota bacterium]